ncbi:MAG: BlaI/MecI/CopY family transcriptional regulator [Planctomycetes bacterium]|nr:BlaI/MecI/CopY family transcriptional regulator [Planctomycetota bacterium]
MPPEKNTPTPAEWKVLKLLFDLGPSAARDLIAAAERAHGWSASTVKTLLRRLTDKGHVEAQAVGSSYLYRATRPAHRAFRDEADRLLANSAPGALGSLLQYLVKKSRLSKDELDELRALIDAQREERER